MNERLIEALLRLCELEKQAQESVIAGLRQEISDNTLEFKELCDRVSGLQDLAQEEGAISELRREGIEALREQVAKAKFERDQARVELKALAEENERLLICPTGWVHIRDFDASGPTREVLGIGEPWRLKILQFEGPNRFSSTSHDGLRWEPANAPVYVMEIPQIDFSDKGGRSDG